MSAPPKPDAKERRNGDRYIVWNKGVVEYENGEQFTTNTVTTSKYNIFTFLPLNLFEQFSNVANLYFLFIGLLQMVPQITTTGGLPTMYQALFFVVCVSAIRAAVEDYNLHVQDSARNSVLYQVYACLCDIKAMSSPLS